MTQRFESSVRFHHFVVFLYFLVSGMVVMRPFFEYPFSGCFGNYALHTMWCVVNQQCLTLFTAVLCAISVFAMYITPSSIRCLFCEFDADHGVICGYIYL